MTITIGRISGFATIQDRGRPGYRGDGVPPCGAMDGRSLALANTLVGNPADSAGIEWALAGGTLRFDAPAVVAVTGAEVELAHNGAHCSGNVALHFSRGDELAVGHFVRGVYAYIGVRGGIDVPEVLGSRSTYVPAGFGGLEGRRLHAGDVLSLGKVSVTEPPVTSPKVTQVLDGLPRAIRALEGPNTDAFTQEFRESFWESEFTISPSSNRTGYRLERDPQRDPEGASAPSEPACVGAIQVANGAGAIVLLADGPTIGGYPKIGVVASVDIPELAQRTPGDRVTFELITIEDAQHLLRAGGSLAQPGASA